LPRLARIVVPNRPHHVTQRGNNRQDVFFVDDDRATYLGLLQEESERYGLAVEASCLVSNHVHLIVRPESEGALAQALGRTHVRYAQYSNRLHGRSGHLWQNRFSPCALEGDHYWTAMVYVEQNPVRNIGDGPLFRRKPPRSVHKPRPMARSWSRNGWGIRPSF